MHDWKAREGAWFVDNIGLIAIRRRRCAHLPIPSKIAATTQAKSVPQVANQQRDCSMSFGVGGTDRILSVGAMALAGSPAPLERIRVHCAGAGSFSARV